MKKTLKIFALLFIIILSQFIVDLSNKVSASSDDGIYTYVFHINFDGTNLTADTANPYDLIAGYVTDPNPKKTQGITPRGEIIQNGQIVAIDGNKLISFNYTLDQGKNNIYVKYFPNAKLAIFNSDSSNSSLTINLAGSSVCNENKICNSDAGESYQNCPSDCLAPQFLAATTTTTSTSTKNLLIPILIITLLVLAIVGILYFLFFKKREND